MSTHNICFHVEIRENLSWYSLSGAVSFCDVHHLLTLGGFPHSDTVSDTLWVTQCVRVCPFFVIWAVPCKKGP